MSMGKTFPRTILDRGHDIRDAVDFPQLATLVLTPGRRVEHVRLI